jgi:hypothetical protein
LAELRALPWSPNLPLQLLLAQLISVLDFISGVQSLLLAFEEFIQQASMH